MYKEKKVKKASELLKEHQRDVDRLERLEERREQNRDPSKEKDLRKQSESLQKQANKSYDKYYKSIKSGFKDEEIRLAQKPSSKGGKKTRITSQRFLTNLETNRVKKKALKAQKKKRK